MNPEALSVEQLAGQRLMVGFEGKRLNSHLKFLIRDLKVGGIILFSQNVATPDQVKTIRPNRSKSCALRYRNMRA
jgi:beta-N-acetylhexosaminidase